MKPNGCGGEQRSISSISHSDDPNEACKDWTRRERPEEGPDAAAEGVAGDPGSSSDSLRDMGREDLLDCVPFAREGKLRARRRLSMRILSANSRNGRLIEV